MGNPYANLGFKVDPIGLYKRGYLQFQWQCEKDKCFSGMESHGARYPISRKPARGYVYYIQICCLPHQHTSWREWGHVFFFLTLPRCSQPEGLDVMWLQNLEVWWIIPGFEKGRYVSSNPQERMDNKLPIVETVYRKLRDREVRWSNILLVHFI